MVDEKRRLPRLKAILAIDYSDESDAVNLFYVTSDISQRGVFIKTPQPLEEGTKLELLISLHTSMDLNEAADQISVHGVVTHSRMEGYESGMGVRFEDLNEPDWQRIQAYVESRKQGGAGLVSAHQTSDKLNRVLSTIEAQSQKLQSELKDYHKDFDDE